MSLPCNLMQLYENSFEFAAEMLRISPALPVRALTVTRKGVDAAGSMLGFLSAALPGILRRRPGLSGGDSETERKHVLQDKHKLKGLYLLTCHLHYQAFIISALDSCCAMPILSSTPRPTDLFCRFGVRRFLIYLLYGQI